MLWVKQQSDCMLLRVSTGCVAKYSVSFRSISSSVREAECGLYFERRRCVAMHELFKSLSAWKLMDFSFTLSARVVSECMGSVACSVI